MFRGARQFDPALREKYFQPHPQGWQIDPRVQQLVKFQHNNLLGDPFPVAGTNLSSMDVILCRNVFIYFSAGAVDQVLDKFVQTLNPDGFLMTGHAELQGHRLSQLRPRSFPESVVYQRSDLPLSAISPASLGSSWNRSTAVPPASATPASAAASLNPSSAAGPSSPLAAPAQFPSATSLASPPAPGTRPPAPPTTRTPVQSVPTAARGAGGVGTTGVGVTGSSAGGVSAGGSSAGGARAGGAAADAGSGSPPPLQDAKARKQRQDYEGMVTGLQAFLINPPVDRSQHLEALVLLAQAQANLGQIQEAQQTCQDALKLDPCSVEIYTLLAQVAEETGDLEGAKVFLKRVIYLDPEAVMAYFNLGLIYEQENSVERARKVQTTTWDLVKRLPPETIVDLEHQRTARDLQAFLEQKL
ncbi:MAG: CheR family methyltransferase [Prochlorothrix sp.]